MLNKELEKQILSKVEKPARYIGNEINQIQKNFDKIELKIILSYPDLYEIAMSNLGLKILYEIINKQKNMLCERVFHPWEDMEKELKLHKIPLYSLESKKSIKNFDIIGFSLQYELTFTNILNILKLGQIPIKNKNRKEQDPIIIAGGPCAYNPIPMKDFIDLFLIGEAEKGIITLAKQIIKLKKLRLSKTQILKELDNNLTFVYVPLFSKNKKIKKLVLNNINQNKYPIKPILPYIQIVQDQGIIELARGCTIGCRFCQAGMIYRPLRERNIKNVVKLAKQIIKNTGYKKIALLSLSIADYSMLSNLIDTLNQNFSHKNISFSFPSLRIDAFNLKDALKIQKVRKTALTFAMEAGSEYTRQLINKNVNENKLLDIAKQITKLGWKHIKLYFMIGFPIPNNYKSSEEQDIIQIINKLLNTNKKLKLSVSIGTFIPKSHTPFQRIPQINIEDAQKKIHTIKTAIQNRRVKFKIHSPEMSFIEGLIARGNENIGKLIYKAYQNGSKFDGWQDKFNIQYWNNAIKELNIDTKYALFQKENEHRKLVWSNIDCGVKENFLEKEFNKSTNNQTSPDCRDKCYDFCGACSKPLKHNLNNINTNIKENYKENHKENHKENNTIIKKIPTQNNQKYTAIINFVKKDILKFLSHIDIFSLFQKAFIRTDLPLVFSSGFNPIPKIDIANPLSLGIESNDEYMQIKLHHYIEPIYIKKLLNQNLHKHIYIKDIYITKQTIPKINKLTHASEYKIIPDNTINKNILLKNINNLRQITELTVYSKEKKSIRKVCLLKLDYDKHYINLVMETKPEAANLFNYLEFITGKTKNELSSYKIERLKQYGDYKNKKSPITLAKEKQEKHYLTKKAM